MSTRSHDSVRFTIPCHTGSHSNMVGLVNEVFRTDFAYIPMDGLHIECLPSQFARFLIERNKRGFRNGFKELQAELINPASEPQYRNVVGHKAVYF